MGTNNGCYQRVPANDHFLDRIGSRQAWFVGLMAADGCIKNGRLLSISQSGEEGLRLIEEIKVMLDYHGKTYRNKNAHTIQICSPELVKRLAEFNVVPRKSLVFTFPEKILGTKHLASFLRGYIDGDGSVGYYYTGTTNVLCLSFVGTEEFIRRVLELVPVKFNPRKIKSAENLYEARFYGQRAIAFGEWIWRGKAVPSYYKESKFKSIASTQTTRYTKYNPLRKEALSMVARGISPMVVAEKMNLPFQTIYKWIKHQKLGCSRRGK